MGHWVRLLDAVQPGRMPPRAAFGPVAADSIESLFPFLGLFELIQTWKIHISPYSAPKIMKPVLLHS
jgi:hypothetical protein